MITLPSAKGRRYQKKSDDRFQFVLWKQEIDEYIAYRLWRDLMRLYME